MATGRSSRDRRVRIEGEAASRLATEQTLSNADQAGSDADRADSTADQASADVDRSSSSADERAASADEAATREDQRLADDDYRRRPHDVTSDAAHGRDARAQTARERDKTSTARDAVASGVPVKRREGRLRQVAHADPETAGRPRVKRDPDEVRTAWHDAERRVSEAAPDSPEWLAALGGAARSRLQYTEMKRDARRDELPEDPGSGESD